MEEYIKTSLTPAKTSVIQLFDKQRRAKVFVQPDQRPLAIGKQGQNVRLASILTGWEIDIMDISDYEGSAEKKAAKKAEEKIEAHSVQDLGIDEKLAKKLEDANLTLVEQLKGLSAKDLSEVEGIGEEGAKAIAAAVKKTK